MEIGTALLLLGGGLVAGFLNTVAGGGSVITLPILIEAAGLPATVANGTNRVALLLQNVVAVARFHRGRKVPWGRVGPILPAVLVGAGAGSWAATRVSPEALRTVFAFVILLVALSAVVKPSRWLGGTDARMREPWRSLAFLGIGFYGGFVQAGVGFLLLAGLVIGGGLDLVRGNAAKVFVVLIYTVLALVSFFLAGQVHLLAGLILGAGNMAGALLAANLALARGAGWMRWVVVAAALGAAVKMLFF